MLINHLLRKSSSIPFRHLLLKTRNNVHNATLKSQAPLCLEKAPPLRRRGQPGCKPRHSAAHVNVFLSTEHTQQQGGRLWNRLVKRRRADGVAPTIDRDLSLRTPTEDTAAPEATVFAAASQRTDAHTMTREQEQVYALALQGASMFIGGEAGTGKSYLLSAIAAGLAGRGLRVAVTASTGIAAFNIGGNTFHSTFGIPLPAPEELAETAGSEHDSEEGEAPHGDDDVDHDGLWSDDAEGGDEDETAVGFGGVGDTSASLSATGVGRRASRVRFRNTAALACVDVIILDEVSMLHAGFLEALEHTLRRTACRDATKPFGGVQVILSGDFMQLTPFNASGGRFGLGGGASGRGSRRKAEESLRRVCRGVLPPPPPVSAAQESVAAAECAENSSDSTCRTRPQQAVTEASTPLSLTSASQRSSRRSARALGKRHPEVWYYDKPMFESWCFRRHLLHLQLRQPQRQRDAGFAADLNALRRGELPYRLSRSALLNAADEEAVRLLPTKAAVRNYNDRRMLELSGESCVFRTRLTITEASSTAAACGKETGGTVDANRNSSTTKTSTPIDSSGSAAHARRGGRAPLLLLFRLRSPATTGGTHKNRRHGHLTSVEMRQVERVLERQCRLPRFALRLRSLPVPLAYSSALCTLVLECTARTDRAAEERRAAVKAALERCITQQSSQLPSVTGVRSASDGSAGALRGSVTLFPRELVRLEAIAWPQLLRRLEPAMQSAFRDAIRQDTVLQDKRLKIGCRVMLLRNLSTTYVNGSLGTLTKFLPWSASASLVPADLKVTLAQQRHVDTDTLAEEADSVTVTRGKGGAVLPIVRMDADGKEVAIPWIVSPIPVVHHGWCYMLRASCIPLTPAYAFTVHKIQGVTLDHAVLFDADGMFPCDHLVYVAASRVRRFEQLRIVNLSPGMISVHVPSLEFTSAIASVDAAVQQWTEWRRSKESSSTSASLFLPSYMRATKRRANNKVCG